MQIPTGIDRFLSERNIKQSTQMAIGGERSHNIPCYPINTMLKREITLIFSS